MSRKEDKGRNSGIICTIVEQGRGEAGRNTCAIGEWEGRERAKGE